MAMRPGLPTRSDQHHRPRWLSLIRVGVLWLRPPGRALNELLRVRGAQKKAEIGQGGKFDKGHATQRVCEQRKNKLPQRGLPCQRI